VTERIVVLRTHLSQFGRATADGTGDVHLVIVRDAVWVWSNKISISAILEREGIASSIECRLFQESPKMECSLEIGFRGKSTIRNRACDKYFYDEND
jgi:hypothetical protein